MEDVAIMDSIGWMDGFWSSCDVVDDGVDQKPPSNLWLSVFTSKPKFKRQNPGIAALTPKAARAVRMLWGSHRHLAGKVNFALRKRKSYPQLLTASRRHVRVRDVVNTKSLLCFATLLP